MKSAICNLQSKGAPVDRSTLESQLQHDGVDYVLVQFVDLHGSPKVKLVPREAAASVADGGAGLARRSRPGDGQQFTFPHIYAPHPTRTATTTCLTTCL